MNRIFLALGTAALVAASGYAIAENDDHSPFANLEQKESYGIGSMIGQQLERDIGDVDATAFLEGVNEGFGGTSKLDNEEITAMLQQRMEREQAAALAAAHEKDLAVQADHGVNFINYWVDPRSGDIFCLSEADSADAVLATHREAHGLISVEIAEVKQGE